MYLYLVGDNGIEKVAGLCVLQTLRATCSPGCVYDKERVIAFHWLRFRALINLLHLLSTQRGTSVILKGKVNHDISRYHAAKQKGAPFSKDFSKCLHYMSEANELSNTTSAQKSTDLCHKFFFVISMEPRPEKTFYVYSNSVTHFNPLFKYMCIIHAFQETTSRIELDLIQNGLAKL